MLTLTGRGQAPASLSGVPVSFAFMRAEVGTTTAPITWTLSNGGDLPTGNLTYTSSIAGAAGLSVTNNNCPVGPLGVAGTPLAGHSSCTISVAFSPITG